MPEPSKFALEWVVIDPGHGGEDRGIVGPGGWTEAQMTMDLAEQVKEALETELGLRVVLTREDGQNPGLAERTAAANGLKADLFLSLHAAGEAYDNRFGFNVYVQDYSRQAGLTERDPQTDHTPGRLEEWSLLQSAHLSNSMRLARELDESLKEVLRVRSRGPVGLPLALLAGANQPAVLIEAGVLSDAETERRLRTRGYRDALTRAIVRSIQSWRQMLEQDSKIE